MVLVLFRTKLHASVLFASVDYKGNFCSNKGQFAGNDGIYYPLNASMAVNFGNKLHRGHLEGRVLLFWVLMRVSL